MAIATKKDQEIRQIIKQAVAESVTEVLNDPDRGLELQDWVIDRVENIRFRKNRKGRSLAQVRKKLLG